MRKIKLTSFIFVLLTITLLSCDKDETDEKENLYENVNFDGVWSGTTNNESTIKFTISNNKVIELEVETISGKSYFGGSGFEIVNGKFNISSTYDNITGKYNGEEFEGEIDQEMVDSGESWTTEKIYK